MARKPLTKGRQKIEMKKIKNESHLGVTFSKRRQGLFKKAHELITLCGVNLALFIYSPGDKVYSFGNPNVYAVIDRLLRGGHVKPPGGDPAINQAVEDYHDGNIDDLNAQLHDLEKAIEAEKNIAKVLKEKAAAQSNYFTVTPTDQLSYPQLLEFRGMLEQLKSRISSEIDARIMNSGATATAPSSVDMNNPPFVGQDAGILFNNFGGNPGPSNYNFGGNPRPSNYNFGGNP